MIKQMRCEACQSGHRVLVWGTPAGGKMRLCVLCRHTLNALAEWQKTLPDASLDSLIAQLPAYLPDTLKR